MRDILLTVIVFGLIPFIMYRPFVGILVWNWLAFMNPQRLTFGFAYDFPYSKIIGILTILAFVFYRYKLTPKSSPLLWVLMAYVLWVTMTTKFAIYPDEAFLEWTNFIKIMAMVALVIFMASDKQKVNALVITLVLSLGFYGFKGGIFTVVTAGAFHVWGPPDSFIADNNALGLALVMILPLMWYWHSIVVNKFRKNMVVVLMVFTAVAVLGTQSRGGFLALMAMTAFLVMKSKARFKVAAVVIIMAPLLYVFMPQSWHDRMDTIKNYQQDESAMMRINAWEYSINLAADHPITGGGYATFTEELFKRYSDRPEIPWTGPHSIYFESLAEQGYPGLVLFVLMLIFVYRGMGYVMRHAKDYDDMLWARDLAAMIQVSIVGYAVAGAFLELAKFDLFYVQAAIGIVLITLVKRRMLAEDNLPISKNEVGNGIQTSPMVGAK